LSNSYSCYLSRAAVVERKFQGESGTLSHRRTAAVRRRFIDFRFGTREKRVAAQLEKGSDHMRNLKTRGGMPPVNAGNVALRLWRGTTRFVPLYYFFCSLLCAAVHVRQGGFQPAENGLPAGWKVWAARAETAPKTFIDSAHGRSRPGSLAISGDSNS